MDDVNKKAFSANYRSFKGKTYQQLRHSFQQYKNVWTKPKLKEMLEEAVVRINSDEVTKSEWENLGELILDLECEIDFQKPVITVTRKPKKEDKKIELKEVINLSPRHKKSTNLLEEMTVELIIKTLEAHNGNRTHTAKNLGTSIKTLRNWNKRYQIFVERT